MKISTRFCFTLLRPNDRKKVLMDKIPNLNYLVYGWEKGPVSGVIHLQGYFETRIPTNIFKLRSLLKGYYVDIARESREQNIIYCTKCEIFKIYDPNSILKSEYLDKLKQIGYTESQE